MDKSIKDILDEIANESSTNKKIEILSKYKDNELLSHVLYLAYSKRIKFYIKQIPEYYPTLKTLDLRLALGELSLLYKRTKTGNEAIIHLRNILERVNDDDRDVIIRVIKKDLRIGMATKSINKVFKNLIEITPYMGAVSFSPDRIKKLLENEGEVLVQIKMDGRYCNVIKKDDEIILESRSGDEFYLPESPFLVELNYLPNNNVLNGELTMVGLSRHVSNGIIHSLIDLYKKKELRSKEVHEKYVKRFEKEHHMSVEEALEKIKFTAWDILSYDDYLRGKADLRYKDRLNYLADILMYNSIGKRVEIVETYTLSSYSDILTKFQEVLNEGEEGLIVKSKYGFWKNGKPNYQIKMKLEMHIDLKIVGFNYGTGKNEDVISSLKCETSNGYLKTQPTGISEKMMKYITEHQDELLNTVVEVKCSGLSQDHNGNYSVLHPVFIKLRDDKQIANTLEEVIEIENMIKGLS